MFLDLNSTSGIQQRPRDQRSGADRRFDTPEIKGSLVCISSEKGGSIQSNVRRVLQIASLAGLIGLSLLYPIIESFDRWDAPGPSSDSELQIIVLLTFVGIVFALGHLLVSLLVAVLTDSLPSLNLHSEALLRLRAFDFDPSVTASPPCPLRI